MIRVTDANKPKHEDLDYIILPKTHSSMYLMHRYWARKPANIVSEYIKKYTQSGEIVLDPFMGSGVTVIESLFLNRKSIGVDINPISHFICANTVLPVDLSLLKESFAHLQKIITAESSLYSQLNQIQCVKCDTRAIITHIIWRSSHTERLNSKKDKKYTDTIPQKEISEIRLECPSCGKIILNKDILPIAYTKLIEVLSKQEKMALELLKLNNLEPPSFSFNYKDKTSFLQLRHDLRKRPHLKNLFSNRNLAVLTFIKDFITHLPKKYEKVKNTLNFCFTGAIGQASKMVWVINKRKGQKLLSPQVGSWTHHFFWDPTDYFEVNAWNCFKTRFSKLLRGKSEVNQRFDSLETLARDNFQVVSSFSEISSLNPLCLMSTSSKSIPIPSNSIDFIFTDPPYGDSIQYGELATLWAKWLDFDMKFYLDSIEKDEIVINKNQKKDLQKYSDSLLEVFTELYRVLKPNKYLILTFHNTSINIRNSLILQVIQSGFSLKQILFQLPPRASIKSLLHHSGTPIGDYFIRFQKLNGFSHLKPKKNINFLQDCIYDLWDPRFIDPLTNTPNSEVILAQIQEIIYEILLNRGEPTLYIWILNLIDELLFEARLFPLPEVDIYLQKLADSDKFVVDSNKYWWFSPNSLPSVEKSTLTDRIESYLKTIIPSVNFSNISQTKKQYLFNLVYSKFRGILTPDKFIINQLVERLLEKN